MQSYKELSPGIKLFFQLGNFFIMDSETLAVNAYHETHQAAISEVLKKNSITEKLTSIKNRVCEKHFTLAKTRLDNQRAKRLKQLLDSSNTLRHEATLLHLGRQRQAMEVKKCLQPDTDFGYEDIRLRNKERHLGLRIAPCYLDKRQQFPVRIRSTKDNSLTPIVRRARASLKRHELEELMRDNSSISSSNVQHRARSIPVPLAPTSSGPQRRTCACAPVSAVSEPVRGAQQNYSTLTVMSSTISSLDNNTISHVHNQTNSSYTHRAQSSFNNHTKYSLHKRSNSSISNYTIPSLDNKTNASLPNHKPDSFHNHTISSLINHTSSFHNHIHSSSHKNQQRNLGTDRQPSGRHRTNEMPRKTVSSAQESGKPVGNSHFCETNPPNSAAGEFHFSDEDGEDDHNLPDHVDLQAHFCGNQTITNLHRGDLPSTKQLLWRLTKQRQTAPKLTMGTARPQATSTIQDKVATFLKNLSALQGEAETVQMREAQLSSPTQTHTPAHCNMNTPINPIISTINAGPYDPAKCSSDMKSSTQPNLINQNTIDNADLVPPKGDTDGDAAETEASDTINTTQRKSKYSWKDIKVRRHRDGRQVGGYSAEDLVLQTLTGIPIRNVFQTPVPLNTASRAMRHTATFKMRKIVAQMIKDRTRYERHQVEELKKQMTLELKGQTIAEEELVNLIGDEEPDKHSQNAPC